MKRKRVMALQHKPNNLKERTTMFVRCLSSLVVIVLVGIAGTATGTAAAQPAPAAMKVFANAQFGYTLSYPATWRRVSSTNLDILLQAPDAYAMVAGKAVQGAVTAAALRRIVDDTISQTGAPATKIARSSRLIHGVTFQVAQSSALVVSGAREQAIVLAASLHQRTYLFFGIVTIGHQGTSRPPTHVKDELVQVQASVNSITIQP
jgi:hypothetical protein